jgi:hypothetical protein
MNITSNASRRTMLRASAALLATAFGSAANAQTPINTLRNSVFGGRTDTAINGYDPVAYFTVGKPVQGLDSFVHTWMDAKWKFASQANLDLFKADPARYAPQYGGYCAYGVAKGNLVKVEPDQFTIRGGKLYLNYDASIQAQWLKDPDGFITQANGKFKSLLKP